MRRVATWAGGFVLITYGLVHLLVWPGAPTGAGDGGAGSRLRWNGESWSWQPPWLVPVVHALGGVLLAFAVLGCLAGGLALLGLPWLRRFPLVTSGTGGLGSLALFALVWPGLEPAPTEFAAAPVLSATLLAGVGVAVWSRRGCGRLTSRRIVRVKPAASGIETYSRDETTISPM